VKNLIQENDQVENININDIDLISSIRGSHLEKSRNNRNEISKNNVNSTNILNDQNLSSDNNNLSFDNKIILNNQKKKKWNVKYVMKCSL